MEDFVCVEDLLSGGNLSVEDLLSAVGFLAAPSSACNIKQLVSEDLTNNTNCVVTAIYK